MKKQGQRKSSIFSRFAVLTGCLLLSAGMAQAALVTYDFTGSAGTNPLGLGTGDLGTNTVTVSFGGLGMMITGIDFGAPGVSSNLSRNALAGLGVADDLAGNNVGADEAIEFDFSPIEVVAISSAFVETGDLAGSLDVFIDGSFLETVTWAAGAGATIFNHNFAGGAQGQTIELRGNTDDFRITALTVNSVPEPGTQLLFATCILGLSVYARYNQKRKNELNRIDNT